MKPKIADLTPLRIMLRPRKPTRNFCMFCQPNEHSDGITPATRTFRGKPACDDCWNEGCEQDYNNAQAEEHYGYLEATGYFEDKGGRTL